MVFLPSKNNITCLSLADDSLVPAGLNPYIVVTSLLQIHIFFRQGLSTPSRHDGSKLEATDVVFEWKRKLQRQRSLEVLSAERGNLGLRVRDNSLSDPSLVDLLYI